MASQSATKSYVAGVGRLAMELRLLRGVTLVAVLGLALALLGSIAGLLSTLVSALSAL